MMVVVGLAIAAIGFACFIAFLWTPAPVRLGGTYRIQCRICKEIDEIENPTVEKLKEQQALFNIVHRHCWQEKTGP